MKVTGLRSSATCWFAFVWVLQLLYTALAASGDGFGQVRVLRRKERTSPVVRRARSDTTPVHTSKVLQVCDCEYASTTYHGGLLCNKEGYFITNFEAVGHWINGGGRVPLSKAKCCRLCLPDGLTPEQEQALPNNANITGLISVGCHASTATSKVSCENKPTTTFATGFQKAIMVPSLASATFYPEGPMTCCVPAMMLSTGDAWEIERCDCEWSKDTGCESLSPDHLLWGYAEYREGGAGSHVPIAPAQCCKACIGDQLHSMNACRSLNRCSRRGVCVLGSCACNEGWGGPDCSHALAQPSWPPAWVVYTAVAASTVISLVLWLSSRQLLSDYIERRRLAQEENQAMLDPLMIAEGEIGGDDSTDDDDEEAPRTPPTARSHASASTSPRGRGVNIGGDLEAALPPGQHAAPGTSPRVGGDATECDIEDEAEKAAEAARQAEIERVFDERTSPLSHVKCKICFERPVQVALVPCGHSNLCRKCSRRVDFCPFCRKPVIRRQRLYLADMDDT